MNICEPECFLYRQPIDRSPVPKYSGQVAFIIGNNYTTGRYARSVSFRLISFFIPFTQNQKAKPPLWVVSERCYIALSLLAAFHVDLRSFNIACFTDVILKICWPACFILNGIEEMNVRWKYVFISYERPPEPAGLLTLCLCHLIITFAFADRLQKPGSHSRSFILHAQSSQPWYCLIHTYHSSCLLWRCRCTYYARGIMAGYRENRWLFKTYDGENSISGCCGQQFSSIVFCFESRKIQMSSQSEVKIAQQLAHLAMRGLQ